MVEKRIRTDFEYIWLNKIICNIPCWSIRKRVYKKHGVKIARGARIGIGTTIVSPSGIYIGERSTVNEKCFLDGRGGIHIGHDCSISAYTKIVSASHKINSDLFEYYERKTYIGDYVWIGLGAIILDGTVVEEMAVVGAGAVVKGKVKKGLVYIGNPARPIRTRRLNGIYRLNYKPYFR